MKERQVGTYRDEPVRVLVADDMQTTRDLLKARLQEDGYIVTLAENGHSALKEIAEVDFDVVVADLEMPVMGGVPLLRAVKQLSPETEVVIVTGHATVEVVIDCLRAGAFDFLRKTSSMAELGPAVARAVQTRRSRIAAALHRTSELVFSVADRNELPKHIVEAMTSLMFADDASLMLASRDGHLYIAYSNGIPREIQTNVRLALGERVAGWVAKERRPVLLNSDLSQDERFSRIQSHGRVKSSIVYPLYSGQRLLGVLNVNRLDAGRRFRQHDLKHLSLFAAQIALALEVQELLRQLAATEKFATLGQLAGGIAHEINNPVSYVLSNLAYGRNLVTKLEKLGEMLNHGAPLSELRAYFDALGGVDAIVETEQALADAEEGAIRIRDVVRDVRSLARSGDTDATVTNVRNVLQVALRITAADLRSCAEVQLDVQPDLHMMGSPGRLSQLFINLLSNAAYAVREAGTKRGLVKVAARQDGDGITIEVSDTGTGIPDENIPKLFEPFFTTKPQGAGTGLGLPLCLEIVETYGGTIDVTSKVGKGTTFLIRFPVASDLRRRSGGETNSLRRGSKQGPAENLRRVLCVDDEEAIGRSYVRMLSNDFHVTYARSAEEALSLLSESASFDAVVCDLLMPGMSGAELFRATTSEYPSLEKRFLFVTGSRGHPSITAFLDSIPNPVLEKPVTMEQLKHALRDLITAQQRTS